MGFRMKGFWVLFLSLGGVACSSGMLMHSQYPVTCDTTPAGWAAREGGGGGKLMVFVV